MPKLTNKFYGITGILALFVIFLIFNNINRNEKYSVIENVVSPIEFYLFDGKIFHLNNYETFDCSYTQNNKSLAKNLSLTEDEAFIIGCTGKYWAKNFLENRKVKLKNNDLIYYKFSYRTKFENSPFAIQNGSITNKKAFEKQLNSIRKGKFVIVDLDEDKYYPVSNSNASIHNNFVVIRKNHIKNIFLREHNYESNRANKDYFQIDKQNKFVPTFEQGNIKILVSDLTTSLCPTRNCSSEICKEILNNINKSKNSIDIAIYGYSSTPAIEKALFEAQKRGVKIRIVYDVDSKGENIYPDTFKFIRNFAETGNDKLSPEVGKTMHNKFYIFDNSIVITGSANLSHTDMSGFNTNSIIVIKDSSVSQIYKTEFDQMFVGKYHNEKLRQNEKTPNNIKIFFSPQDKGITNGILPIIKNAEKYIYVPAFIITHKGFITELINAKNRGVDVKVIVDSLNATGVYSKHKELRAAGIPVKAENYAGKMHAKTVIVDDKYLIIGSMNFSSSGENKNDENMVILNSPDAARFYREFFLYQWNKIPEKWLNFVPRAEGLDSIGSCYDGLDNNYDGKTDKDDLGCIKK